MPDWAEIIAISTSVTELLFPSAKIRQKETSDFFDGSKDAELGL
jgi:hypothetical protein